MVCGMAFQLLGVIVKINKTRVPNLAVTVQLGKIRVHHIVNAQKYENPVVVLALSVFPNVVKRVKETLIVHLAAHNAGMVNVQHQKIFDKKYFYIM